MDIIQSIILGLVEGVTEFLPISSTFHLIFTSQLLGVDQDEFAKVFEVFIQSGAILSVLLLYWKELIKDANLIKKTIVAFLPTAVIGLVLYKIIKNVFFESPLLMLIVFILIGVVFILYEKLRGEQVNLKKTIKNLTYKDALIIGLIQACAIVPGVSRAGAVLLGMMFMGYKREESAKFSFILAMPTILAASVLDLIKGKDYLLSHGASFILLLIGFIAAFITSYFVIKWLIGYLKSNSLMSFGIYRIALGVVIFLLLFLR